MTNHVLPYIHEYTAYKCKNLLNKNTLFLIVHTDFYSVTDSLTKPNFISLNYEYSKLFKTHLTNKQMYYSEKISLRSEQILFTVNYSF